MSRSDVFKVFKGDKRDEREACIEAAIELLRATPDRTNSNRWNYYAEETNSYWSVSRGALVILGKALLRGDDRDAAYNTWAEADTTSFEMQRSKMERR